MKLLFSEIRKAVEVRTWGQGEDFSFAYAKSESLLDIQEEI